MLARNCDEKANVHSHCNAQKTMLLLPVMQNVDPVLEIGHIWYLLDSYPKQVEMQDAGDVFFVIVHLIHRFAPDFGVHKRNPIQFQTLIVLS